MSRFQSISLRRKLQGIILITAGIVLLLSFSMLMVMEIDSAQDESKTRLRALAKVLGANSSAAMTFLDKKAAQEVLATLSTQTDVLLAQLIKPNGEIFSDYQSSLHSKNHNSGLFSQRIVVKEEIDLQGEKIGTILIEADMSGVRKTLAKQGIVSLTILIIAMVFATLLSHRMQKIVSKPINRILLTMKNVADNQDFSQRAERISNDELGSLADGFNNMLEHIQSRDQELSDYRHNLEQLVETRTQEIAEKNTELTRLSRTDWLTGLSNRLRLDELFEQEISRAARYKLAFSVILLDIDKFKHINDNHGHDIGDKALIELAFILDGNIRDSDFVGRWGGDEFLIICPETDKEGVSQLAEHLRQQVESHRFPTMEKHTSSFGTSTYQPADTAVAMIQRADMALLDAKEHGRNKVHSL